MVSGRYNIIEHFFRLLLVRVDEVGPSVVSDILAIIRPLATTSSNFSYSCFNLNKNRCERVLVVERNNCHLLGFWDVSFCDITTNFFSDMTIDFYQCIDCLLTNLNIPKSVYQTMYNHQIFTVPLESDTSLQINGTSLFNCMVDAPNLEEYENDNERCSHYCFLHQCISLLLLFFLPIVDNLC